MSERDKAQALMVDYGKHAGKMDAAHGSFDENNDRSFGDFGFHYFPEKRVLQARVYVSRTVNLTDYPDQVPAVRKSAIGLNDPSIGGMFDRAGGYFVLDEQKQMFFLVRDFPISQTDALTFANQVDALRAVAGIWVTKWLGICAMITHGHMPKPTQRIDVQHDPYPRDWQQTMVKP